MVKKSDKVIIGFIISIYTLSIIGIIHGLPFIEKPFGDLTTQGQILLGGIGLLFASLMTVLYRLFK